MENNSILKRLRFTFDFSDDQMMKLFSLGDLEVDRPTLSNWLKKDDHEDYTTINDKKLAAFLNGLIVQNRGKKDGKTPVAESRLNNNLIFWKLKIALSMRDDDIIAIYDEADMNISKHELSAIFRKPGQKQYRECKDQFMRNFLMGLQFKHRPESKKEE